jgi:hypothetical protein
LGVRPFTSTQKRRSHNDTFERRVVHVPEDSITAAHVNLKVLLFSLGPVARALGSSAGIPRASNSGDLVSSIILMAKIVGVRNQVKM